MRRHVWSLPLVTVCLLISTAAASAECAWVLWLYETVILPKDVPKSMNVVIDDIADTQERCKSLMSASVARSAAEPDVIWVPADRVPADTVVYQHKNGETEVRNYMCIPDTKDLRVLLKDLPPWMRRSR